MREEELVRHGRWALRESPKAWLQVEAESVPCRVVCSREGIPLVELQPNAPAVTQGAIVELHARGSNDASVTLRGTLVPSPSEEAIARFAAFFPDVERSTLHWLDPVAAEIGAPGAAPASIAAERWLLARPGWVDREGFIIDHMNRDHAREMSLMCRHFYAIDDPAPQMLAVDPEGMHLRAGGRVLYFRFERCCDSVEDVAGQTIELTRQAGGAVPPRRAG